jgi:hypothetical protein
MYGDVMKNFPAAILAVLIGLAILCGQAAPLQAQEKSLHSETESDVPALDSFHGVIAKIWHEAWPVKNVAMLVEVLPSVDSGCRSVAAAELPGILRERKSAWEKGVNNLKLVVEEYRKAASPVDSVKLLVAAERLHSQYEKLVRIIRPVLPELDAFHKTLYRLYHTELPADDSVKIVASVKELAVKMAALHKAELPKRLAGKAEAFAGGRLALEKSMEVLAGLLNGGRMEAIKKNIETMHSCYEALEKVFE